VRSRELTDPTDLLKLARSVAVDAAALVRERGRAQVRVEATKSSPVDVVTETDQESERFIRRRLLRARPDDGFVGEEGAERATRSGVTWVVDPIDGTVNFLYGLPHHAVSVAARVGEEVAAGVVVDVGSGECFTATAGGGAFVDRVRLRVRMDVPMEERLVLTGFSYRSDVRRLQGRAVARMLPRVRDIRRLGAGAIDLCMLAAGRADAYVEEGLRPWDIAAGGLVAREAGARVETRLGAGGDGCLVAAPEAGFAAFSALVQECGFLGDTPAAG
jgi:myo-inositol-1(or 4)-monophosphatase